ncbi:TetR/AcrR family transcriptional regulator [Paenibacillus sp. MBLB4367]|uniref:TetR/AcrR family transcriptional regulator n=1 Tax=Paenibacillus sp. MBLB4367 TaxID=3384767 RepID=UPI00390807A6
MAGNKEKVLVAAAELFHLNGFQATGLEDILSRSGVCKSNFYYHFKSKDDLGLQVVERQMADLIDTMIVPTLDAAKLDVRERLRLFFLHMIDYCEKHDCRRGCLFGNLALELGERHESMRAKVGEFFHYTEKRITSVLAEAVRGGQLSLNGLEPEEAAASIVALLQGSILLTKGYTNSEPMRHSLKMMLHFLGAPEPRAEYAAAGKAL